MTAHLRSLLLHPERRGAQAQAALATIEKRHTCRHRVDELLDILKELRAPALGHDRSNRDAMEATAA
jgi:spore maturation protein CgeB